MHRPTRSEGLEIESDISQRSSSMSSDRPSIISTASSLASPPAANPEPAYIAASAACQIVTREHHGQSHEWFDERGGRFAKETALVSPASLSLVNAFLDQLLFNFFASARSTSLASLRAAIAEVLKPRLAREAIAGADEELQESLGGGDDEELLAFHNGQEPSNDWDLDLIWKKTRLRCMVYTRLGDMEEDDEDAYIEQEHLEDSHSGAHRLSRDLGAVSPAVAIFLTSILEFIGEHALLVAGEAAYKRIETKKSTSGKRISGVQHGSPRVVVEEIDMEKVAFNTTLGRLWRAWRKRIRSPRVSMSKPMSHESIHRRGLSGLSSQSDSRKNSVGTNDEPRHQAASSQTLSVAEVLNEVEPASIPLPWTDHDIDEIEVPGYSLKALERARKFSERGIANRPFSTMFSPTQAESLFSSPAVWPAASSQAQGEPERNAVRPGHHRSNSLPPSQTPFVLHPEPTSKNTSTPGREIPKSPVLGDGTQSMEKNNHTLRTVEQETISNPITPPIATVVSSPGSSKSFQGSVLNAISQHAARELKTPLEAVPQGEHEDVLNVEHPPILESTKLSRDGESTYESGSRIPYSSSESAQNQGLDDVSPLQPDTRYEDRAVPHGDLVEQPEVSDLSESEKGAHHGQMTKVQKRYSGSSGANQGQEKSMDGTQTSYQSGRHETTSAKPRDAEESRVAQSGIYSAQTFNSSPYSKHLQGDDSVFYQTSVSHASDAGNTASNLAPPREMMDDTTPESSDEGYSLALNHNFAPPTAGNQRTNHSRKPASQSSPSRDQVKDMGNGGKLMELRHKLPPVYTGLGIDRAAVQRVSLSPEEFSRTSTSSNRDQRAIHTSGSNTSQISHKVKGVNGYNDKELLPSRTSSDGSPSHFVEKYNRTSTKPKDKERSFEQLIKSDETLQYTLTPQNMREMEAPDSPRWSSHRRSGTAELADFLRNEASPVEASHAPSIRPKGTPIKGTNGLRSNPIDSMPQESASDSINATSPRKTPGHVPSKLTAKQGPQPVARDARIEKDSTRDFADFIRSTGPESEQKTVSSNQRLRQSSASRSTTAPNGGSRSVATTSPMSQRTASKNDVVSPRKAESNVSKRPGPRLQARDATIPRNGGSSELIDFIRQGPPIDRSDGNHRIPRTVAPFRTTMDSDEIRDLGHGKSKDAGSITSTVDSSLQSKSLRSSSNSRTGLLESSNKGNRRSNGNSLYERKPSRSDEPAQPIRKQRRIRDPYAIDTDSEEDNEFAPTPGPRREEESLMEFLRSVAPSSQGTAVPSAFDNVPHLNGKTVQRKTSAPSMRDRFARNGSVNGGSKNATMRKASAPTTTTSAGNRGHRGTEAPQIPPFGPRATSPHLVSQVGSKMDTYKPTSPTYAAHIDRQRNGPSRTARAAREERESGGDSRDLADFLKNSAPPTSPPHYAANASKEEGGFKGLFSRKKKNASLA